MRNFNKYIFGSLILGAFVLAGCENAKYDTLTNQAYILQTGTDANTSEKITIGNDPVVTNINVRLSDKAVESSKYRIVYDAAALEKYNTKNETSYTALPESSFSLSSNEAVIEAGNSVSTPMELTIRPLNDEMKNSGKKYAIAFRLESTDGKANILSSGSVMVYLLDQVVIQPVVVFNSTHNFGEIQLDHTVDLPEWTVELNINKDQLRTEVGRGNNQAFFGAYSDNSEIYMRFGDAPIEGNRINIKTQGSQMNSQMLFNTNTWYHLALVCTGPKLYFYVNGVLDNSMDLPNAGNSMSCFSTYVQNGYHLGNSMFSELRLWKKARTQNEIINNMYSCDPASDGLVFYFKFNEGSGNTFKDASGHGYDISTPGVDYTWIQDVRIDGK